MEKSTFPRLESWTKDGKRPDVWMVGVRTFVGTVLPGLLHRMIGEDEVARLHLPALGITEALVTAPDNLNNEPNRAQAKMFKEEQDLIRRVTTAVKAALPDGEMANIEASMVPAGAPVTLSALYETFRARKCIQTAEQAAELKREITGIVYRHGDDIEVILGRIRILDSALEAAANGRFQRDQAAKIDGLINTLAAWPNKQTWKRELRGQEFSFQVWANEAIITERDFPVEEPAMLSAVKADPTTESLLAEIKLLKTALQGAKPSSRRTQPHKPCKKHPKGVHTWDECSENPDSVNHGKTWKERKEVDK
jgi:hypothetical protein